MAAPTVDRAGRTADDDAAAPELARHRWTDRPDRPRRIGARTLDDKFGLGGAAVSSFCLVWLLYEQLLPTSGVLGFFICWYVAFIGLYAGVTAMSQPRPIVVDRIASAVVHGAAAFVGFALVTTLAFVFIKGWPAYTSRELLHPRHGRRQRAGRLRPRWHPARDRRLADRGRLSRS